MLSHISVVGRHIIQGAVTYLGGGTAHCTRCCHISRWWDGTLYKVLSHISVVGRHIVQGAATYLGGGTAHCTRCCHISRWWDGTLYKVLSHISVVGRHIIQGAVTYLGGGTAHCTRPGTYQLDHPYDHTLGSSVCHSRRAHLVKRGRQVGHNTDHNEQSSRKWRRAASWEPHLSQFLLVVSRSPRCCLPPVKR